MNATEFKQKIKDNLISDEELENLLSGRQYNSSGKKGGLVNNLIKGYIDGYTTPNLWKVVLEFFLILVIILSVVFLNYSGKIESPVSTVILSSVLGFVFGKIK